MREADYRAWDKEERRMIQDFTNFAGWEAWDKMDNAWRNERYVKMQFTGIRDGGNPPKKIYEGDIVRFPKYYVGDYMQPSGIEVIEYEGNGFNDALILRYSTSDYVEVIGNIFENPNLLEYTK